MITYTSLLTRSPIVKLQNLKVPERNTTRMVQVYSLSGSCCSRSSTCSVSSCLPTPGRDSSVLQTLERHPSARQLHAEPGHLTSPQLGHHHCLLLASSSISTSPPPPPPTQSKHHRDNHSQYFVLFLPSLSSVFFNVLSFHVFLNFWGID